MELKDCIRKRQSIRAFQPDRDISKEKISEIIELSLRAPSGGNLQPWSIIAIKKGDAKDELARASYNQMFIAEAPWVLVIIAETDLSSRHYGKRGEELYSLQDTSALIQTILLLLVDEDLATCWIGAFDEKKVSNILGIEPPSRPVALLPIGYPAKTTKFTSRRDIDEVVSWIE